MAPSDSGQGMPGHRGPPRGPRAVDIHSHVLPGVDDGARDDREALQMLQLAADDGTRVIVATPHASRVTREQITHGVERLNAIAMIAGVDILVLPGSEVRLTPDIVARAKAGTLVTLNDSAYMLVELPRGGWAPWIRQALFDLQMAGYWPILGHVERHGSFQRDPQVLVELARQGVLLQVNAGSLTDGASIGRRDHDAAAALVQSRLVHIIASDAHDPQRRRPVLQAGLRQVELLGDAEYAGWIRQCAVDVINGLTVTPPEPEPVTNVSRVARLVGWLRRAESAS